MNQLISFEFSEFSLIWIILTGLILSFFFRILRRFVVKKFGHKRFKQIYDIIEITVWMIFGLLSLKILLKGSLYYMMAVLSVAAILLIWFGWFIVRDFIAGLVLKFSGGLKPGQQFSIGDIKGKIANTHNLYISIKQSNGMMTKIPYHKISESIYSETVLGDMSTELCFEIEVIEEKPFEKIRNEIRKSVLLTPGVSINKEPKLTIKKRENNKVNIEIIAYLVHAEYSGRVIENVKRAVGNNA